MRPLPPGLARRLAAHGDRLHAALSALAGRLREAVAQAVGSTVAGAVREALQAVVATPPAGPAPLRQRPPPLFPAWGAPYGPDDDPYADDDPRPEDGPADEPDPAPARAGAGRPVAAPPAAAPRRGRWQQALAVGCQAAAWWLRRQAGRGAALAALGLGLVAAAAAFTAGAGLAGAALGLLTLADVVPASAPPSSFADPP
jgi:hypothetical protein